jgi:nicotinamide mononucleotide transporter
MSEISENIIAAFYAQSWLEIIAVVTAILYLVLVVKENIWCWLFAFISTAIYIYLFHSVALLSESLLNVYYLIMAVYGWWQWQKKQQSAVLTIQRWRLITHLKIITGCLLLTPIIGFYMQKLGASFPYIDAFVLIMAIVATLLVVYKVFENWYYWLIIDTISIYLFWQKQMYLTALLFVIYIALIFAGIRAWKIILNHGNSITTNKAHS